ncbi:tubulin-specific chaperone C [Lingula anatina]|uniref:Tubulin-specific chaperone C n=1 Tax=Lingula anatina TaxID=7574 RepID=A0A1S3HD74_LINAN|nr:tubulin-specific chaperone C [Lingula anatina]|eukprot:XP_013383987.1 tubulin-specific chaperone C [Lingula anatina]
MACEIAVEDVGQNFADLNEKRNLVTDRLQRRDEERLQDLQKKKEDKEKITSDTENTVFFNENFNAAKAKIEADLMRSDDITGKSELTDHFDALVVAVQSLQKFVSDSTLFLPKYEIRSSQDVVNRLTDAINEKRDEKIPKKKFAFKSKKKSEKIEKKGTQNGDAVDSATTSKVSVQANDCGFMDLSGQSLSLGEKSINQKDVAIMRLTDCVVKLHGSPSAIHIDKLTNCKVFSGPVSASIFIDNCTNCTFVLPCQQLRIHSTTDTSFYIHVTSKAIIEDCSRVVFAPYNWYYNGIDEHYRMSGLDKSINNWDDVDDFNWLVTDQQSPNWGVIPVEERVENWET